MEKTEIKVPMVGKVIELKVKVGDPVRKKDVIAVMESMKMKIPIYSIVEGVVRELNAQVGQVLNKGHILAVIS
ncbi:MAG: acetyl-CoA carboxylase biotin carboxyl carrier protein subunit [Thermodesulfobacteriota bacterium]|nr:acetyl-CoA carboxylase biotin carboxyl carrier protein subunit [Thermodesulfobacteriota bacterium]